MALAATSMAVQGGVRPSALFTDHMVIQRETQAPVWGWSDAGEEVTVSGSWGASATATADHDGRWRVNLQTPEAGGPHTLLFKAKTTIELTNVMSGDVWLCSGQSNMQWPVAKADNPDGEAKNAKYPNIRHFKVGDNPVQSPAPDCKGGWQVCSSNTVLGFSATAYFTGRALHKNLEIPIGLLTSAVGGTPIESWTPPSEQMNDPLAKGRKTRLDQEAQSYTPEKAQTQFEERLAKWKDNIAEAKTQQTKRPRKPRLQKDPLLSKNYPGNLYNGMIHPLHPFAIKGALWYQGESNAGMAPQSMGASEYYRVQLDRMIRSWRKGFGQDFPFYAVQLPNFRALQEQPVQAEDTWPAIRESVTHTAQHTPGVATAAMIDLGQAKNIHPKNKQDVGLRMASTILNKTYGKDTPTTPFMKKFTVEGGKGIITFDYSGSGLMVKGDELKGFAIAGADKTFVWADAEIVRQNGADRVEVSSKQVKEPVAVRYGWADNPVCNLTSREGFPASPFRTDRWDLKEASAAGSAKKDAATSPGKKK